MTILAQKHKKQAVKRKNFLPALLLTVFLWGLTILLVYFVDPGMFIAIPLFFVLIFGALLFTFSLLLGTTRRGIIASISLTFFLFLSYLGVGNILNLFLIVAIAVSLELYLAQK